MVYGQEMGLKGDPEDRCRRKLRLSLVKVLEVLNGQRRINSCTDFYMFESTPF